MGRTKNLAESQFDASAAPISLGNRFENYFSFHLDQDIVENDEEVFSYPFLFTEETDDLPIAPEHLIPLANDMDPVKRDEYEPLSEEPPLELELQQPVVINHEDEQPNAPIRIYPSEQVNNIDYQIKHAEIKEQISHISLVNKVTSAVRLVNLAIDKMSPRERANYNLDETTNQSHPRQVLIDKSTTSIRFINQLGTNLLDTYSKLFPDRLKNIDSDELTVDWINNQAMEGRKLDCIIACAYMAKKLKFTNIELNDNPGSNLGITSIWRYLTCHQLLYLLNLHTIDLRSNEFNNFRKVVKKFPTIHGGPRLLYLEYLVSEAEKGDLFFESHDTSFYEKKERWKDARFSSLNDWIDKWSPASDWLNSVFVSPVN